MKTTLDLPDDLLIEAKAVAARRRITLKDMVTHALRREISPSCEISENVSDRLEVGPFGILRLKNTGKKVSAKTIQKLSDEADSDEFDEAIKIRSGK
jgi:hypothetical protein